MKSGSREVEGRVHPPRESSTSRPHDVTTSRKDAYREKPRRTTTWSGLEVQNVYSEKPGEPSNSLPGEYPYTRGIHADMYRGRYWTRREVCGIGGPKDTNALIHYLLKEGQTGVNVIFDIPTMSGIDADHPRVPHEIGVQGASLSSYEDMKTLFEGIDIEGHSVSLVVTSSAAAAIWSMFLELAQERGVEIASLRGTVQNDPLHHRYCGYPASFAPINLALHTAVDIIEYATKKVPKWHPINVNGYDYRESGINAPEEIAFALSEAESYIQSALARGLPIDSFSPRFAFYMSAHIDLFEEVAKLRAARRMWAKMLKEKYQAREPESMKFHFAVHTAGCALYPQQPHVNIVRIAYQALAATLAGTGSLHCCAYDEPFALPTRDSHRLALRTQQVLAYESGVANTADPLGGSYYVEDLTDRMEREALAVMDEIDQQGGMIEAIDSGWIDARMDRAALKHQREIETGERTVVGVNAFSIAPEEDAQVVGEEAPAASKAGQIRNLQALKKNRDSGQVRSALARLREAATKSFEYGISLRAALKTRTPRPGLVGAGLPARETGRQGGPYDGLTSVNLIPTLRAAARAGASLGEIMGTIREAFGETYDPLAVIRSPF